MAIYYVDGAVGNDANLGTSEGAGNAWATIDKAMNTVAAGDKTWIKASATYAENPHVDTVGTEGSPVVFEGYTSTTGDGGRITINASGLTNGIDNLAGAGDIFHVFKNIIVSNASGDGFEFSNAHKVTFKNCRANNNGGHGFGCDNYMACERCDSYSNSGYGYDCDSNGILIACRSHTNASGGALIQFSDGVLYGCLFYGHGASDDGASVASASGTAVVINCTFDGENLGDEAILFPSTPLLTAVVNCIVYDWATGISAVTDLGERAISAGNLYNSNTANTANYIEGDVKVSDAPGFTDEASDDYTLAGASAAKAAGVDAAKASVGTSYVDIGALQRAEAGGGVIGGPNKRAGKQ